MVTVMVMELVSVVQNKQTKGEIKTIHTHLSVMLIIRLMFQGSFTLQN